MEIRPEIFGSVYFMSSKKFKCNLQSFRQNFFQAANGIFGKIGLRAPHKLILSLIDTFCIPVLLYGVEAMPTRLCIMVHTHVCNFALAS